jgi:hypothetical protein
VKATGTAGVRGLNRSPGSIAGRLETPRTTPSSLIVRAIEHLNRTAEAQGVSVRQSSLRVTAHARRAAARRDYALDVVLCR